MEYKTKIIIASLIILVGFIIFNLFKLLKKRWETSMYKINDFIKLDQRCENNKPMLNIGLKTPARTITYSDDGLIIQDFVDGSNHDKFKIIISKDNLASIMANKVQSVKQNNKLNSCTKECQAAVISDNGEFKLITQNDGNLVIYDKNNKPIWSTNTINWGKPPYKTIMQNDGNLVLYDSTGKPAWSSAGTKEWTKGAGGPYTMKLTDMGNITTYDKNNVINWKN